MNVHKFLKMVLMCFSCLSLFATATVYADGDKPDTATRQTYTEFSALTRLYSELLADIDTKTRNNQEIDWDQVAQAMGVPPASADATLNKLKDLYAYTNAHVTAVQTEAVKTGMSLDAYLDANGGTSQWWATCHSTKTNQQCAEELQRNAEVQRELTKGKLQEILDKTYADPPSPPKDGDPNLDDNPKPGFLDVTKMLEQIRKQIPSLVQFVYALCYLTGFALFIIAIFKLKAHGENLGRGGSVGHHGLFGPIIYAFVATCLVYFPTIVSVGTNTFMPGGGDGGPLAYPGDGIAGSDYESLYRAVIEIIKLVGVIAFFRGWLLLSKLGNGQAQQGTLPKSLLHLVGGVLAVNIVTTWDILRATFGYVF